MSITCETTVGRVAAEHPLATRVFARHGIDFCCGGGRPLKEACDAKGLDPERVLDEIRREVGGPQAEKSWDDAPLGDLIDHIVCRYHRSLDEELPRLEGMARKVLDVHGDRDARLAELLAVFLDLKTELDEHMAKEEQILFPMIRGGHGAMAGAPISVMEHEHDSAGAGLRRLRELTDDYVPPVDACTTWRALWAGLATLEEEMHRHIHLENEILFPRALAG